MESKYAVKLVLLLLSFSGRAMAGEGLPEFKLNSLKVSTLRVAERDLYIPPPSPPARQGATSVRYGTMPAPIERYPLYRPYQAGFIRLPGGFLRTRLGSGGEHGTDNVRITGKTKLTTDGRNGKAEIKFPAVEFEDELPGDEAFLFVKATGEDLPPELSWAAVICAGSEYLGYKGSTLKLPAEPGGFTLTETLALGGRKGLVSKTHPWLAGEKAVDGGRLDYLCSPKFRKKMKDYTVQTLPRELAMFHFRYDAKQNALKITWRTDMD
ncbi:MAG: hypothetical protein WCK76_14240 [Elusimicrobiota bacterium]